MAGKIFGTLTSMETGAADFVGGLVGSERSLKKAKSLKTMSTRELSRDATHATGNSSIFFTKDTTTSTQQVVQHIARDRRGEIPRERTCYECFDDETDDVLRKATDPQWCLEQCGGAEALKKDKEQDTAGKKHDTGERVFGLPNFDESGFCLTPPEDTKWLDRHVPDSLGFQLCVHRKTSVERMCLAFPKSKVPSALTKEHLTSLVRNLKRCDHANLLKCTDVLEDTHCIYLLYESYSCVTLLSVVEEQRWTQEQVVNLIRECCSAVGFAMSCGLNHLGWSLCHILLPPKCLEEDPYFAKVFGFGLMGQFHGVSDRCDFMCWAPEAVEMFLRVNDGFVNRLEPSQKHECDLWSLGTVIYSIIAGRPPICGPPEEVQKMITAHHWGFNVNFDSYDPECKQLVEGLMFRQAKLRTKADVALFNPWLRRRWKPPGQGLQTFFKLEEFCSSSLPKKLFGRFLVKFLDADHMRIIATRFFSLDTQGDGSIDAKDIRMAGKSESTEAKVKCICGWMCPDGSSLIPLSRFAESMAEEVIDGKALRHSFESLDDDGSECISPQELFEELARYDSNLTMQQVLDHIIATESLVAKEQEENSMDDDPNQARRDRRKTKLESGEAENTENDNGDAEGEGRGREEGDGEENLEDKAQQKQEERGADHMLDFDEYIRLFPGRMKRVKVVEDRIKATRRYAGEVYDSFDCVRDRIPAWLQLLENEQSAISKISTQFQSENAGAAVKQLKQRLQKVASLLSNPPGPTDMSKLTSAAELHKKQKKAKQKKMEAEGQDDDRGSYGFDSFVQDEAMNAFWPILVDHERKMLKGVVSVDSNTNVETIDHLKASDSAQNALKKCEEVQSWVKAQLAEYESFTEVLMDSEPSLPSMVFSSRGLQKHGEDGADDEDGDLDEQVDETAGMNVFSKLWAQLSGK